MNVVSKTDSGWVSLVDNHTPIWLKYIRQFFSLSWSDWSSYWSFFAHSLSLCFCTRGSRLQSGRVLIWPVQESLIYVRKRRHQDVNWLQLMWQDNFLSAEFQISRSEYCTLSHINQVSARNDYGWHFQMLSWNRAVLNLFVDSFQGF